jgi:hypothetical protein
MIHLFQLYERFIARVNTHQGGHASPHRKFMSWVKDINIELFQEYYKAYEKSKDISDKITPFYQSFNVVIEGVPGQMYDLVRRPDGYSRIGSIRVYRRGQQACGISGNTTIDCNCNEAHCPSLIDADEAAQFEQAQDDQIQEVEVVRVDSARWSALAKRQTKGASFDAPKCTLFDEGFKIAPKRLGVVVVDFFRLPVEPVFNYKIINQGTEIEQIQFVEAGSVHLEWDATLMPEFLARLETMYGTFIRNSGLVRQGEADKAASN